MKKIILFFGVMLLCSTLGFAQTTMTIGDVSAGAGSVTVPINVQNFTNVGAISLKISYNSSTLTFAGVQNAPVTFTNNAAGGVITLGWFDATASSPINIASGKLLDLNFTSNGGSSNLDFVSGQCEIADEQGNPLAVTFDNGNVIGNDAIEVALGSVNNAVSGNMVSIPLTVTNFNGVGAISYKINFDPDVLSFVDLTGAPGGVTFTSNAAAGVLSLGWFDNTGNSPINLGSDTLVNLRFTYNSGSSSLSFNTSECELSDSLGIAIPEVNYFDGSVSGLAISLTIADVQASPNTSVSVPIVADNFDNVGAISLKINYNATVLDFTGVSNAPTNVTFTANASGGVITIGWFDNTGNNPIGIGSDTLLNLNFNFNSGSSDLSFDVGNCEISNNLGIPYTGIVYNDGNVTGQSTIIDIADIDDATPNSSVVVPVNVDNFISVGAISLKIEYNASVLTFNGVTSAPTGVIFTTNASGGVITIGWFDNTGNTPITITSGKLFDLNFAFASGTSALTFQTAQCEISSSTGIPIEDVVYLNGSVSSAGTAPVLTLADVFAFPDASVSLPLTVERFNGVGAISLKVQYDPQVADFVGVSNTPAGQSFTSNAAGGVITIGWFDQTGNNPLSIANDTLLSLDFNFTSGSTDLAFNTAQCEISDSMGTPITDITYHDGSITQEPSTATAIRLAKVTTLVSDVTVPLSVARFNGVGAISLKIQYNAAAVAFLGTTNGAVPITSSAAGGVITLGWFDATGTNPLSIDSAKLVDLRFVYNSGATDLTFLTDQCEVSDSLGNPITGIVYVNGRIEANEAPFFTAEMPDGSIQAGVLYTFDYDAEDPNGETLTYSLINPPAGATIDPQTGVFTWNPGFNQVGNDTIIAMVSDGVLSDTSTAAVLGVTEVEIDKPGIPNNYTLKQNFPNPFNPSTTIEFDVPKLSNVVLKVYNILGQEIVTLVNKEMPAGYYRYNFDASRLTSGTYIYKITAGDFVSTKKMLFIK